MTILTLIPLIGIGDSKPAEGADYCGKPVLYDIAPPAMKPGEFAFADPADMQPSLAGGNAPSIVGAPAIIYGAGSHPHQAKVPSAAAPYPIYLSPAPGNYQIPAPVMRPSGTNYDGIAVAMPQSSNPPPSAIGIAAPALYLAPAHHISPAQKPVPLTAIPSDASTSAIGIPAADPSTHPVLPPVGMIGAAPLLEAMPVAAVEAPMPGALVAQAIYIPPGATIPMYLDRPFSSGFSHVGDIGYARIANAASFGIPTGSIAELVVLMVEPARRGFARPGRIQIGSNRLILPDGQSVYLRGLVINALGSSYLKRASGSQRFAQAVGKAALGAGVGALVGLITGAISGGTLGSATLVGAVAGVVVGGVWAAFSKGKDIELPSGLPVMLLVSDGAQATY
ncbi:MAG: hypothetical protein SFT81_02165 [Candidatus Caenarcaniphilales bacterium]|nr:hypothetical protein [Candidatus Caenarcaniphilales bacterium]